MFDRSQLARAVDLRQRSYELLLWLSSAVDRDFVRFETAHRYASVAEAAHAWLRRHYDDIPDRAKPAQGDLVDFSRLFATYLACSFDLVRDPGKRLYSPDAHCFCPCCSWLVDIPRLQPKKLTRADKRRARRLERDYLVAVAAERDRALPDEAADALVDDPALREPIALCAYGVQLLRRLEGHSAGPAVLALWRSFAWLPAGSPKKGYALTADAIVDAERTVRARVARAA